MNKNVFVNFTFSTYPNPVTTFDFQLATIDFNYLKVIIFQKYYGF